MNIKDIRNKKKVLIKLKEHYGADSKEYKNAIKWVETLEEKKSLKKNAESFWLSKVGQCSVIVVIGLLFFSGIIRIILALSSNNSVANVIDIVVGGITLMTLFFLFLANWVQAIFSKKIVRWGFYGRLDELYDFNTHRGMFIALFIIHFAISIALIVVIYSALIRIV